MGEPAGVAIPLAAGALVTSGGELAGIAAHVTGAAAATVRLWDNASAASGTLIGVYELTASGADSFVDACYHPRRRFANGLFLELVTGHVEGSVFV